MASARTMGFSLLVLAAACARQPVSQAPQPLKPEDGPKASVWVDYTGGLLNRSLQASFRTEQFAYVMVGHLGGDGRIRVLFPESPDESGYVRGKKYYRTVSTPAYYDAIPSLFSYTASPYRGAGAMHDSYDGRGHGYVFIIASRTPLRYEVLYDYGDWAELEMDGYTRHHDPRYAIRSFANVLAGGAKYTLKFATSFMTTSFDTYATRAWDCAMLSSLGMFGGSTLWSAWHTSLLGFRFSPSSYCGQSRFPSFASGPIFTTVIQPPVDPVGEPAPRLDRPGRRGLGPRTETTTRVTLTRVSPSVPRDPGTARESFDRGASRRPMYGTSRGRTDSEDMAARVRPTDSREHGARTSSPRDSRPGGESRGSTSSASPSSGSSPSSSPASSSGETRSGSGTASPRDERRKPDGK